MTDHVLDATGLICPLPVLKAKKAIRDVPVGERLTVLATDPGAEDDMMAFCHVTGHRLVDAKRDEDGVLRFVIERTR